MAINELRVIASFTKVVEFGSQRNSAAAQGMC